MSMGIADSFICRGYLSNKVMHQLDYLQQGRNLQIWTGPARNEDMDESVSVLFGRAAIQLTN